MGNHVRTDYENYDFVRIGHSSEAKVYCKNCPTVYKNTSKDRVALHYSKCPKTGGSLIHQMNNEASRNNTESTECDEDEPPAKRTASVQSTPSHHAGNRSEKNTPCTKDTPTTSKAVLASSGRKQSYLMTDSMGKKEGQIFQDNLADFFFANRIAFRIVDDHYFRKLLVKTRPACEAFIPSRQTLSTKILDEALKRYSVKENSNTEQDSCLLMDSWKNKVTGDKWFCMVLHRACGFCSYLKSVLMTQRSESTDELSEVVGI